MSSVILLDIEGTTTPIDFVHKTLFPFARERMDEYIAAHFVSLGTEIEQLADEHILDSEYEKPLDTTSPASVAEYLKHLIDVDRKSTPLKSIQGRIWQEGYESGELKSIVYDDIPPAFEHWHAAAKHIAIYSSGSVLAQQLLFRYTDHGDLTPFISEYFDTNVGGKRDADSYRKIAAALDADASTILFVSDIQAELDAAKSAGFQTALSIRQGNADLDGPARHEVIRSFSEITI